MSKKDSRGRMTATAHKPRRIFLLQLGSVAALWLVATGKAFSAWPKALFTSDDFAKTLHELTAGQEIQKSPQLSLEMDDQTQNGARVRVAVASSLPDIKRISILVENNPVPLISQFLFHDENEAYVQFNLKMQESSNVLALVEAGGKFFKDEKFVKVVGGGCA